MAASPSQSKGSYAAPTDDPEMKRKRMELASRLFQARQAGKGMGESVSSETGVDVGNIQQGVVDTAGGTGLSEGEIAGFAERLYAGKYDTAKKGSVFDQQERAASERSKASGAFGGPNLLDKTSETAISTPRLDKLDALQAAPFGSSSTLQNRRSLESESGKAMRMARKLARQGFGSAAERMALTSAEAKMGEPSIKTEAYREQQSALGQQSKMMDQEALDYKKKFLQFQKDMLSRGQKEINSPTGLSSSTATYFQGQAKNG